MASTLYQQMNSGLINQLNQFKTNPMQFLAGANLNIPNEYSNNPQMMVQYLLTSGQMSQQTFNNLRNMASTIGINV